MPIANLFTRFTAVPLLLFTAVSFLYYLYSIETTFHFMPTANYSIDTVLKDLAKCEQSDHEDQDVLLRLFHTWTRFAHEHNLQYWITDGTLIGYVQRGGLLPHDFDLDILMLPTATEQLAPLGETNFSSRYMLKVHPQWYIVGEDNRSRFRSEGINFIAPNARFEDRIHKNHVDIFPAYDFHPNQPKNATYLKKTVTVYDTDYQWISFPNEWIFPLKPCIFSDIKTWCPASPERIVTALYGSAALNQTDRACVNGTWVRVKARS